jgi:uncharacterized protein YjbI with pentapeptide repeats
VGDVTKRLKLEPTGVEALRAVHSRLKGVHEFLAGALEAVRGQDGRSAFVEALGTLVPWAGSVLQATANAASESLPPVKFLLQLFEDLTELDDPNELGLLACTLAYQRAVEQAVPALWNDEDWMRVRGVERSFPAPPTEQYDFATFTWDDPLAHPFIKEAAPLLEAFAERLGLGANETRRLQRDVHARFVQNLKGIVSHGKTRERFAPFAERIALGSNDGKLRNALLEHADTQRWLFEERPVLGAEAFALGDVYTEPTCTVLRWGEIGPARNPFDPQLPRKELLGSVFQIFSDPDYRDAVFVQGPAGSGKSSFTVRLCAALFEAGLSPIRIELKHIDARPGLSLVDAFARAFERNDLHRFPGRPRFLPQGADHGRDLLALFNEEIAFRGRSICPYVLILDGWDELPLTGSDNYLERLRALLRDLRETFLLRREPAFPVRIVLAGRPSNFLAQTGLLNAGTRVLTLQPWLPDDLQRFMQRIERMEATAAPASGMRSTRAKSLPPPAIRAALVERLRQAEHGGGLDALGSPLIALLCLRFLTDRAAADETSGHVTRVDELLNDTTTLYRHLVDLVVAKAAKPPTADFDPQRAGMFAGSQLRLLLHRTAEAMSVLGVENIGRDELALRLGGDEELEQKLGELEHEHLSRLMISFFFKGGHPSLGCEFSHKSFREYLFAEAIVRALLGYGTAVEASGLGSPPKRLDRDYWKEFDGDDPRFALSRRLCDLLAPQWLTSEVSVHVRRLISWEVTREDGETPPDAAPSSPLSRRVVWQHVRDGLDDLWNWWGEGVHLRPQPQRRKKEKVYDWQAPLADEVARQSRFRSESEIRPPPIRLTTVDAHLGEALCLLATSVHAALAPLHDASSTAHSSAPPDGEAPDSGAFRFAPSGRRPEYFRYFAFRIGAAGYRPSGEFPAFAWLEGVDLRGAQLDNLDFSGANLSGADLSHASLRGALLVGANLSAANLSGANLNNADLGSANLRNALLQSANLSRANLAGASLGRAVLISADLDSALLGNADLGGANLRGANLSGALLGSANLSRALLSSANLSGARVENANLSDVLLICTTLDHADLRGAIVTQAQLDEASGTDVLLDEGLTIRSRRRQRLSKPAP